MRLAAFISAVYYTLITIGISVSLHFCKGELTCFSLVGSTEFCCHHEDSNHQDHESSTICEKGCCTTDFVNIALDTDFTLKSIDNPNVEFSLAAQGIHVPPFVKSRTVHSENPSRGSPSEVPIYLLNSSLIFYS